MSNQLITEWLEYTYFYEKVSKILEQSLMKSHQLALNEFYVLLYLYEEENYQLSLQELQKKIGLSQSAMSRLASRMESKDCGVIRRHGNDSDKRGVYASLTDKGINYYEEVSVTFNKTLEEAFNPKENNKYQTPLNE